MINEPDISSLFNNEIDMIRASKEADMLFCACADVANPYFWFTGTSLFHSLLSLYSKYTSVAFLLSNIILVKLFHLIRSS